MALNLREYTFVLDGSPRDIELDEWDIYARHVWESMNSLPAVPNGAEYGKWGVFTTDGALEYNIILAEVKRYSHEHGDPIEWLCETGSTATWSMNIWVRRVAEGRSL